MSQDLPPPLDYEAVKDFFFDKLEKDRKGRGRMESALYHTAQWIFLQGCNRHDELAAEMERRGMNHKTPIEEISYSGLVLAAGHVDSEHSLVELARRCPACCEHQLKKSG